MEQTENKPDYLRLFYVVMLLCCAVLSGSPWLDRPADSALNGVLSSTLVLFASVRGVDSVVSALSGTELSLTPAGVGMTMAPGELLEPVDDLIEQLGEVLTWVLTLIGLEKLGLGLLGGMWMRAFTATVLAGAAAMLLLRPAVHWPPGVRKVLMLLIMLRVLLPLAAIGSELIANHVVDNRTSNAESALVSISQDIAAEQSETQAQQDADSQEDLDLLDRLGNAVRSMGDSIAIQARMERLSRQLENGVNHIIDLLALVMLRALLFPALFVVACWLLLRVAED
jgi:hypothetical protein